MHVGALLSATLPFLLAEEGSLLGQGTPRDFVHILAIGDRRLLRGFLVALFFAEDGLDLFIKVLTAVTHEKNLQSLLNGDTSLEVLIVHEECHQVVELSGFEVTGVRNAPLVHSFKLKLANETVQIVIDLPNDELDVGACGPASKELKRACNVHCADLVVVVLFRRITAAQKFEHAVQLILLNGLDLNGLEDLGGARLQLLHLVSCSNKFSFIFDKSN